MCESKKYKKRGSLIQKNEEGNLICYTCLEYKPHENFANSPRREYRDFKTLTCNECRWSQTKELAKTWTEDKKTIELLKDRFDTLKRRSKKNGWVLDFEPSYLIDLYNKQKGVCNLTGLKMTSHLFNGRNNHYNVSVDRIDKNKGYIKGNIQLVCWAANFMKNDFDMDELIKFCKLLIKNYEG